MKPLISGNTVVYAVIGVFLAVVILSAVIELIEWVKRRHAYTIRHVDRDLHKMFKDDRNWQQRDADDRQKARRI